MNPRAAIAKTLRSSAHTLIVCHVGPDGDCLGAGLALRWALQSLGALATVASADGVPASLRFLPGAAEVVTELPPDWAPDVAVTLECSGLDRTGRLEAAVRRARVIVAIDHHADLQPYAHQVDWDRSAAAVGEQVADLITQLGAPIDQTMAICLLTALVTDTGAFRYANTTPHALRLAADLIERGASVHGIVREVYEQQPASALRLLGRALAGLTLHHGGAVAVAVVTPAMREAAGAGLEEASGIAALLRTVAGVRLAMSLEDAGGVIRVSLRSRDGVRADRVARALGGGGHPAAAGADVRGTLEDVMRRALDLAAHEIHGTIPDEAPSP
ncbi:MAG: DHHA1 domain-containing protein [Armatimonadota bacterium]|nr:DHHA1 domain-containing protein [Armatimonadota bacterium]